MSARTVEQNMTVMAVAARIDSFAKITLPRRYVA
jgi:hypothetical protein